MLPVCRDQTRFEMRNFKNIDTNNTAFLFLHTSNVWMGIRLVSLRYIHIRKKQIVTNKILAFRLVKYKMPIATLPFVIGT